MFNSTDYRSIKRLFGAIAIAWKQRKKESARHAAKSAAVQVTRLSGVVLMCEDVHATKPAVSDIVVRLRGYRKRLALLPVASCCMCACLFSSPSALAGPPVSYSSLGQTNVVDVRTFGAVLDGVKDDSGAIRAAFNSMILNGHPRGTLLVPTGTAFLASGLDFNLGYLNPADNFGGGAGEHFEFITQGVLKPAPGIGTAVRLRNGYSPVIDVKFFGGGALGDVGLAIEGLVGPSITVEGRMFGGTVVKADATGDITKRIRAVNYMSVLAINCGQAIDFRYIDAFGSIDNVIDFNCTNGSYFGYSTDIGIKHYENFSPASQTVGIHFEQCNGLHLGTVSLGDRATEALMKITGGDFGYIHELRAEGFNGYSPGSGLKLVDVKSINIGHLETGNSPRGLYIKGCGKVEIGSHHSLTSDDNAVYIEAGTAFTTATLHIAKAMYNYTGFEAVKIDKSVTGGRLFIGGEIELEQVKSSLPGFTITSASTGFHIYAEGLYKVYRDYLLKAFSTPNNASLVHVTGGSVSNWP